MLLVKAGAPVDAFIDKLVPLLDKGDIIIDGGNSEYQDSRYVNCKPKVPKSDWKFVRQIVKIICPVNSKFKTGH